MSKKILAIDAWASFIPKERAKNWPPEFIHIFRKYKAGEKIEKGMTIEEMLADMDKAGVEIAVLSAFHYGNVQIITNEEVSHYVQKYPQRFIGAGTVDPRKKPMEVVREIEYLVKDLGLRALRLEPYAYGNGMVGAPPNEKMYWPIYAKCCELKIPVCIQVGHTGPLMPSECGRPIYLDEVALAFPELVILGCHLGQPWHEEMMILAWKHPNVYVETSARTPKYWPKSFVDYVKSWGQDKVIWATDYPLLSFERTLKEIDELGIEEKVKKKIIRDNAKKAFGINKE